MKRPHFPPGAGPKHAWYDGAGGQFHITQNGLAELGITDAAARAYYFLVERADAWGRSDWGVPRMAKALHWGTEKMRRALAELEAWNLIDRQARWKTTLYTVRHPKFARPPVTAPRRRKRPFQEVRALVHGGESMPSYTGGRGTIPPLNKTQPEQDGLEIAGQVSEPLGHSSASASRSL